MCSSGCSGPTACSGRWRRARSRCRSSIGCSPASGTRGSRSRHRLSSTHSKEQCMKRWMFGVALVSVVAWSAPTVLGFCGFYVAKADTKLFNKASQVVLVRDGDRTVMTMANDFKGNLTEFAVVIPVPTFLQREQIHVGDKTLIDHLDAYSAPRLVEYYDADPCRVIEMSRESVMKAPAAAAMTMDAASRARSLGVTI